jgi:hypothetical protein
MTEGMQRLWAQKPMLLMSLVLGLALPSKALIIWIIIASFFLLATKFSTINSILLTFTINFLLVAYFPEFYI